MRTNSVVIGEIPSPVDLTESMNPIIQPEGSMTKGSILWMFLGQGMESEKRKGNRLEGRILSTSNPPPVVNLILRGSLPHLRKIGHSQKPNHYKRKLVSAGKCQLK